MNEWDNQPERLLPVRLQELSPKMRRFLASIDDDDIENLEWVIDHARQLRWLSAFDQKRMERQDRWDDALVWLSKTGGFGGTLLTLILSVLGAVVVVKQAWDIFFPPGRP